MLFKLLALYFAEQIAGSRKELASSSGRSWAWTLHSELQASKWHDAIVTHPEHASIPCFRRTNAEPLERVVIHIYNFIYKFGQEKRVNGRWNGEGLFTRRQVFHTTTHFGIFCSRVLQLSRSTVERMSQERDNIKDTHTHKHIVTRTWSWLYSTWSLSLWINEKTDVLHKDK